MVNINRLTKQYENKREIPTKDLSYDYDEMARLAHDSSLSVEQFSKTVDDSVACRISGVPPTYWLVSEESNRAYLDFYAQEADEDYDDLLERSSSHDHDVRDEAYEVLYGVHMSAFKERFNENETVRNVGKPKQGSREYVRLIGGLNASNTYYGERDDEWWEKFDAWQALPDDEKGIRETIYPSYEEFRTDFASQRKAHFIKDGQEFVYGKSKEQVEQELEKARAEALLKEEAEREEQARLEREARRRELDSYGELDLDELEL